MSEAAGRKTTRDEDIVYCLLSLFGVNMLLLYRDETRLFAGISGSLLSQHMIILYLHGENMETLSFLAF